jgi:hypothetical protein
VWNASASSDDVDSFRTPGTLARVSLELAMSQWTEGERRLAAAPADQRPTLERVTGRVLDELRRRLGGPFTAGELAALYGEQGTGWCLDIAYEVAPGAPYAWDARTTADAAFARYLREAADYAGGRIADPDESAGVPPGMR